MSIRSIPDEYTRVDFFPPGEPYDCSRCGTGPAEEIAVFTGADSGVEYHQAALCRPCLDAFEAISEPGPPEARN